jgi:hypothetical protein
MCNYLGAVGSRSPSLQAQERPIVADARMEFECLTLAINARVERDSDSGTDEPWSMCKLRPTRNEFRQLRSWQEELLW